MRLDETPAGRSSAIAATKFTWRDGERTIHFGPGALADAPRLLAAY